MAHLRRLIWFMVGVLLIGAPMLALARDYVGQDGYLRSSNSTYYASVAQACGDNAYPVPNGSNYWNCYRVSNNTYIGYYVMKALWCPYGGTLNSSTSICKSAPECPAGTTGSYSTGQCVPNQTPQEQCEASGGYWGPTNTMGGYFEPAESCFAVEPMCAPQGYPVMQSHEFDARCGVYQGQCPEGWDFVAPGNLGGGQCALGGTPPEPEPEPEPDPKPEPDQTPPGCAPNQQSGTVQGVPVCINKPPPPPIDSSDTKIETKPTPDGGSKETTTTTNTTVNNTTNTTTTTTTVTTVIKDAAGNVTGTTTDTSSVVQDSAGYCKENPGAEVCGEGGGEWAGGCDDPGRVMHECKGDPIQCAIAEQTLRTRCALAASDEVVEAFKSMVEFDGTGEGEGLDRKEISVPETLEVSEIGGGVGLVDKSYTVMGRTITVPFSAINTYLDIFGAAMMMIAWIVAFNTIRGAI